MARGKFLTADEKRLILIEFTLHSPNVRIASLLGRTPAGVAGYLRRVRDGLESPPLLDEQTTKRLWIMLGPSRAR